jgi:hypothetical protein
MILPARENQYRWMALERSSEHLGTLNAQTDAVIFDGRESRLRNARALRELVLAHACSSRTMRTDSPTETLMRFFAGRNSFIYGLR